MVLAFAACFFPAIGLQVEDQEESRGHKQSEGGGHQAEKIDFHGF